MSDSHSTHAPSRRRQAAAAGFTPCLWPTLALSLLFVAAFAGLTWRLTQGLEVWTYEDLRRRAAAQGELRAPALALRDAQGQDFQVFGAGSESPVYLVNFIYTRCLTVCQVLGNGYFQMQEALRATGNGSVRLLSLSIDPSHDLQPQLAAHGRLHKADPGLWTIAAPRNAAAGRAAMRQLGVVAVADGLDGFVHNGGVHLIDGQGRVRAIYDQAQWPRALVAARRLTLEGVP